MSRSYMSALCAGFAVLCGVTQALGSSLCRPAIIIKDVQFADIRSSHRTWTAILNVDASECSANTGRFEIRYTRLKENAPDLPSSDWFAWKPGSIQVSLDFWADEAILDYSVSTIAPCGCRN